MEKFCKLLGSALLLGLAAVPLVGVYFMAREHQIYNQYQLCQIGNSTFTDKTVITKTLIGDVEYNYTRPYTNANELIEEVYLYPQGITKYCIVEQGETVKIANDRYIFDLQSTIALCSLLSGIAGLLVAAAFTAPAWDIPPCDVPPAESADIELGKKTEPKKPVPELSAFKGAFVGISAFIAILSTVAIYTVPVGIMINRGMEMATYRYDHFLYVDPLRATAVNCTIEGLPAACVDYQYQYLRKNDVYMLTNRAVFKNNQDVPPLGALYVTDSDSVMARISDADPLRIDYVEGDLGFSSIAQGKVETQGFGTGAATGYAVGSSGSGKNNDHGVDFGTSVFLRVLLYAIFLATHMVCFCCA